MAKGFTYTALSTEQRSQIAEQRIQAYEADHFGHELNKRALESHPDSDEKTAAIAEADAAQAVLEAAIAACRTVTD